MFVFALLFATKSSTVQQLPKLLGKGKTLKEWVGMSHHWMPVQWYRLTGFFDLGMDAFFDSIYRCQVIIRTLNSYHYIAA